VSSVRACDACLARTWLVARLAGVIEIARRQKRRLREILALTDDELVAALGRGRAAAVRAEFEALDVSPLREAIVDADLEATCRHDEAYPKRLLDLDDAPAALFVAGGVDRLVALGGGTLDEGPHAVAVVGTRRASPDGLEVARALGRGLSATGVTVVSGMALGIDSASHGGAVEAGGRTVAVLACGADVAYPASKARLRDQIVAVGGCVVSELPPGFTPLRWCFPARNRIIAALSHMTVVVEAARRSGSLITAEIAGDLGREIGAVPGSVTSWRAAGTNELLRDGAALVRDVRDVLDAAVGIVLGDGGPPLALTPPLRSVLVAVAHGRDTLAALAGAPEGGDVRDTLAALTELELLGYLRRGPGGRYLVIPS
jgi:DNA processing protein